MAPKGTSQKRAIKPGMAGWEWEGAINSTKLWAVDCSSIETASGVAHQFCLPRTGSLNRWVLWPQGWTPASVGLATEPCFRYRLIVDPGIQGPMQGG